MTVEAKVIQRSSFPGSPDLITVQMRYPRFIHAECKTHRVLEWDDNTYELLEAVALMDEKDFSRNASSSRAIPAFKLLAEAMEDPAMPEEWHYNQPGMQGTKRMSSSDQKLAETIWLEARDAAVEMAQRMLTLTNPHKQTINRLLEPFTHISVIVTATEWENFFALRCHPDADPTMRRLAVIAREVINVATPNRLETVEDWHTPYAFASEFTFEHQNKRPWASSARCARVSYMNHDGTAPELVKDLSLAQMLRTARHMSPFEHPARPAPGEQHGNLRGWKSLRAYIEGK